MVNINTFPRSVSLRFSDWHVRRQNLLSRGLVSLRHKNRLLACNKYIIYVIPLMLTTILHSLIVKKLRRQTLYGVRNLVVDFSSREKRSRNVLKMSLAIVVVFFLSMSPFVVYLSLSLFSPEGKFCLSKDLVHANGILNELFLRISHLTRVTTVASCQSFHVFSAPVVPYVAGGNKWR